MLIHLRELVTDPFVLFMIIVQPIIYSLLIGLMLGQDSHDTNGISIMISGGMMSLWVATLNQGITVIIKERRRGTLDLILGTPLSPLLTISAKICASLLLSIISFIMSSIIAMLITGQVIIINNFPGFILSLLMGILGSTIMGLWFAGLAVLTPGMQLYLNAFEIPGYILGCFVISIESLPLLIKPVSFLFLPYWISKSLRDAAVYDNKQNLIEDWLIMICIIICYAVLASMLLKITIKKSKQNGMINAV